MRSLTTPSDWSRVRRVPPQPPVRVPGNVPGPRRCMRGEGLAGAMGPLHAHIGWRQPVSPSNNCRAGPQARRPVPPRSPVHPQRAGGNPPSPYHSGATM